MIRREPLMQENRILIGKTRPYVMEIATSPAKEVDQPIAAAVQTHPNHRWVFLDTDSLRSNLYTDTQTVCVVAETSTFSILTFRCWPSVPNDLFETCEEGRFLWWVDHTTTPLETHSPPKTSRPLLVQMNQVIDRGYRSLLPCESHSGY